LALVVAGDARLAAALHAGLHLRGGRRPGVLKLAGLVTSSVHSIAELHRARRAGAVLLFISPAFPTASHPGGQALGVLHWRSLASRAGAARAYALGGVDGKVVRRLGPHCAGAGAIEAMM
jgi:thiamine-phosphate pyrophosphorylase